MHRLPAFLTVGAVAGLAGAGAMWLFTRGTDSAGLLDATKDSSEFSDHERIGVPRKFDANPEFTSPDIVPTPTKVSGKESARALLAATPSKRGADIATRNSELPPIAGSGFAALPAFSRSGTRQGIGSILETKPSTLSQKAAVPAEFADALAAARIAAEPQKKQGFTFREEYWAGVIENDSKAVTAQLFRGNAYWFVAGTDVDTPNFSVHVYDSEGTLVEDESTKVDDAASASVIPKKTGAYYVIITHQQTRDFMKRRTAHWALLQGYR